MKSYVVRMSFLYSFTSNVVVTCFYTISFCLIFFLNVLVLAELLAKKKQQPQQQQQ